MKIHQLSTESNPQPRVQKTSDKPTTPPCRLIDSLSCLMGSKRVPLITCDVAGNRKKVLTRDTLSHDTHYTMAIE
ncbi:hypothetical protein TNCV_2998681 [Trichonephila clavipes]|nr:hypothetical protein TNCV_2998681 [Trichonephila clavipes]